MNHSKIKIKEADIVKIILAFLDSRNLHVSMRTLEKETGVVNCSYTDDILFLRELILDGDWDEVLLFVQPFERMKEFHSKKFKYLILKQKFFELLSLKSHIVGETTSNSIEQVMKTLHLLEENCPSKEEYSNLCWLLTVPNLSERNEFKEWSLDNSRQKCFLLVLEVIGKVIPIEIKDKRSTDWACKERLMQLIIKGLLYEKCIECCQIKAMGKERTNFSSTYLGANLLPSVDDDYSANLLSWVKSLNNDVFSQPFEHVLLDVVMEKLQKYEMKPRHSVDLHSNPKVKTSNNDTVFRSVDNLQSKLDDLLPEKKDEIRSTSMSLSRSKAAEKMQEKNPTNSLNMLNFVKTNHSGKTQEAIDKVSSMSIINQGIGENPESCKGKLFTKGHDYLVEKEWKHEGSVNRLKSGISSKLEEDKLTSTKNKLTSNPDAVKNECLSPVEVKSIHLANERNFVDEKEMQRQLVLKKLEEYENKKKVIQQQLLNLDNVASNGTSENSPVSMSHSNKKTMKAMEPMIRDSSDAILPGREGPAATKSDCLEHHEKNKTPLKSLSNETYLHTNHTGKVDQNDSSGFVIASTPKPGKDRITENPFSGTSPVQNAKKESTSYRSIREKEISRITDNQVKSTQKKPCMESVRDIESKYEEKENAPDGMPNNRKGPMINGVRRTLITSHRIFQETNETESNQEQFEEKDVKNQPVLDADVTARPAKLPSQNAGKVDHPITSTAKGPGPKIKTRDGSKVYVTELLKSREEIKNASANQNQDSNVKEERVITTAPSNEAASNPDEKRFAFSPVCMLEDSQAIRAVCFHPDGNLFAVGANSKTLRICTVQNLDVHSKDSSEFIPQPNVVFKRNRYHKGSIYCLAWNPSGELVATGSNDKSIKLVRFDPQSLVQEGVESELTLHNGTVRELAFVPDKSGVLISGGAGDGKVQVTDCATQHSIGTLSGHSGNVMSVYAGYGDIVATGSTDNTLRLWDLRSLRCIDVILVGDNSPASVALNANGSYLASGQEDGFILLYDISAGRTLQSFRLHREDCRSVRFAPDSRSLLTGSYDTDISLLHIIGNLESTLPRHYKVAGHKDKVIQCRWHPTKDAFISSSADRTVVLWSSDADKHLVTS